MAKLETTCNITDFRIRVQKLGFATHYRLKDALNILDELRQALQESCRPTAASKPPVGDGAAGEVEGSVMSAEDLDAITNRELFWKTAKKFGLIVRVKSFDSKKYIRRPKADIVEDYRQLLAESQRSSGSACGASTLALGRGVAGEVEGSVMSAENLNAITEPGLFRKTAKELGLTVRVKLFDGKKYIPRPKADIVEDYRQLLAESQRSGGSACSASTLALGHGVSLSAASCPSSTSLGAPRAVSCEVAAVTLASGRVASQSRSASSAGRATAGGDGSFIEAEVQRRDALRARAGELGVKRYRASDTTGRTIWRKSADLVADCNTVIQLAKKRSLPSLFGRQLKSRQAPDSE